MLGIQLTNLLFSLSFSHQVWRLCMWVLNVLYGYVTLKFAGNLSKCSKGTSQSALVVSLQGDPFGLLVLKQFLLRSTSYEFRYIFTTACVINCILCALGTLLQIIITLCPRFRLCLFGFVFTGATTHIWSLVYDASLLDKKVIVFKIDFVWYLRNWLAPILVLCFPGITLLWCLRSWVQEP